MSLRNARKREHKDREKCNNPLTHSNGDKSGHALDRLGQRASGDSYSFSAKSLKRKVQCGEIKALPGKVGKRKVLIFEKEGFRYKVVMDKKMEVIITVCKDLIKGGSGDGGREGEAQI